MKTSIVLVATLLSLATFASKKPESKVPETLPQNLELKDELQKFRVTTTHFNGDIYGNFFNKQEVFGEYTRGLEGGKVKWNKVTLAFSMSPNRDADFVQKIPITYMEDFSYLPGEDMMNAEKFKTFTEHAAFTKNLVWDMLGIEGFAWAFWDKLQLNVPYSAPEMNGRIELAGEGFFENKDIQLTYTGISEKNGELCATIEYRTMNNPLELSSSEVNFKGRSHYWGTIWVSLEDKQIEHALLFEDVLMEMLLPGQTQKSLLNATREITYERVI